MRRTASPAGVTADDVRRHGDVRTALGGYHRDKVLKIAEAGIPKISERMLHKWIEEKLISPGGFRGQIVVEPSGQADGLDLRIIRRLIEAWLVREDSRPDCSSRFELSHDRLIEPILANARWFTLHRPPFRVHVMAWVKGSRPKRLLLRGAALADAIRWRSENPDEHLIKDEVDYLEQSREVRTFRRRRRLAARAVKRRTNLADLGWGVIVPHDVDPAVLDALEAAAGAP